MNDSTIRHASPSENKGLRLYERTTAPVRLRETLLAAALPTGRHHARNPRTGRVVVNRQPALWCRHLKSVGRVRSRNQRSKKVRCSAGLSANDADRRISLKLRVRPRSRTRPAATRRDARPDGCHPNARPACLAVDGQRSRQRAGRCRILPRSRNAPRPQSSGRLSGNEGVVG